MGGPTSTGTAPPPTADGSIQWSAGCSYPSAGCEIGPSQQQELRPARRRRGIRRQRPAGPVGVQRRRTARALHRPVGGDVRTIAATTTTSGAMTTSSRGSVTTRRFHCWSDRCRAAGLQRFQLHAVQPESECVRPDGSRARQHHREHPRLYNGFEWTGQGRFGRGGFFGGSVNYERTARGHLRRREPATTRSGATRRERGSAQYKAHVAYPIPKIDVLASVFVQGYPGPDISANYA